MNDIKRIVSAAIQTNYTYRELQEAAKDVLPN